MRQKTEKGEAQPANDTGYQQGLRLCTGDQGHLHRAPTQEAEPGMVGKLEKSLYGTRDAALNWAEAYTKVLLAMGYKKGLSNPGASIMRNGTSAQSCTVMTSLARGRSSACQR